MFTDPLVQLVAFLLIAQALGLGGNLLQKRLTSPSSNPLLAELAQVEEQEDMIAILKKIDSRLARLEEIEVYRFKRELKADKGKVA